MKLSLSRPFIHHDTDPLYLANGTFGGFQDLSATQMDLWNSSIGSRNLSDPENPVLFPVIALHTAVWYLGVSGKGVCKIGSEITCDMRMRKTLLSGTDEGHALTFRLQPEGGDALSHQGGCSGGGGGELPGSSGLAGAGCPNGVCSDFAIG